MSNKEILKKENAELVVQLLKLEHIIDDISSSATYSCTEVEYCILYMQNGGNIKVKVQPQVSHVPVKKENNEDAICENTDNNINIDEQEEQCLMLQNIKSECITDDDSGEDGGSNAISNVEQSLMLQKIKSEHITDNGSGESDGLNAISNVERMEHIYIKTEIKQEDLLPEDIVNDTVGKHIGANSGVCNTNGVGYLRNAKSKFKSSFGNANPGSSQDTQKKIARQDRQKFTVLSTYKHERRKKDNKEIFETTSNKLNFHKKEKKYVCGDCHKTYLTLHGLKNHIVGVHVGKKFSYISLLRQHSVVHSRTEKYVCEDCGKEFFIFSRLTRHIRAHLEKSKTNKKGKRFTCDECDRRFFTLYDLKNHIKAAHLRKREYKCAQCDKRFSWLSHLHQHNNTVHINDRKFECDICHKRFLHLYRLRKHSLIHSKTKKYECECCGKRFFAITTLMNHMNLSHIKSKDYQCEFCDKAFVQKNQLRRHTNGVHYKIKNYECQTCHKKFQAPHHLRNHLICVHEKVKNFVCVHCGNNFFLAHHLRNHVNGVHKGIFRKRK